MIWKYILNRWDFTHPLYHKSYINKIFNINWLFLFKRFTESFVMNRNTIPYSKWKFLWYTDTFRIIEKEHQKHISDHDQLNLLPEPNKKIASFYEVLNNMYQCALTDSRDIELKWWENIPLVSISMRDYISLLWGTDGMDNRHISAEKYDEVFFEWFDVSDNDRPLIPYENWKTSITKKEFYLLMQIYYGLYEDEDYLKELEKNEQKGKYNKEKEILSKYYDENQKIVDWNLFYEFDRENVDFDLLEEYLKLKLMQQDISWTFGWIKIEKIYDKDWDETRQKSHIEAINKEFWEEVIIME